VKVEELTIIVGEDADTEGLQRECQLAVLICLSANGARHLANTAPNEMTPTALAEFAEGIANESGCECTILDELQMATLGMNALLGVSRGSAQPPKFIVLRYQHEQAKKTIAIVGKGVTFDSGGISIKPAESMHEMKYDMCGAAAVLCTMLSIVEFKPKLNVVCVVPASENMTGASAQRPGDIVKAYNGTSIEVLNTDAEGRLLLADALSYTIKKYHPDAIVDLATLTGACVVALGHYAAGMMGNNDELMESLRAAGEETGERVWPLPLWDDYDRLIDGTHADIANIGPRGEAGAITAAAFLQRFVGDTPWVHLDIAGTAWGAKNIPYLSTKHASGYGVRLLVHWLLSQE
jgi:leucyl aminopeptidase